MTYLFLALAMLLVGVAVNALVNFMSQRRSRTAERLSTIVRYGFDAEAPHEMLPKEPGAKPLEVVMTRLGDLVSSRFGAIGEEEMRGELMAAGMYSTSPRTMLGYRIILAVVLPVAIFVFFGASGSTNLLLIVISIPVGWTAPLFVMQRKAKKRLADIDRALPDLIDLLTVMVEAGLGFGSGLRMAATHIGGPLSAELRLTLQEQTMGLAVDEALANMADRCKTPSMLSFVRAMAQGERMGISTGQIMRNLSHEMRAKRRAKAEEKAQKAPVKMLVPLVLFIFPSLFIILMTPAIIQLAHTSF
jgi:tight adherence protein C